jgi:hypothetical protein
VSSGALALHRGALYVGSADKTARVRAFDLDGAPLEAGFDFADPTLGRSSVDGLALDDDRHVWVADRAAGRVRLFTLFGVEVGGLGVGVEDLAADLIPDRAGDVREPVGVAVDGDSDGQRIAVASGGERRHALQVFGGSGRLVRSLAPEGDPRRCFRRLAGLSLRGRLLAAAEAGAGRVQVFRDGEFLFAFPTAPPRGFAPTAVALLPGGRFLVAHRGSAGGIELFDAGGRHLHSLAQAGLAEGSVHDPTGLAVDPTGVDRTTRVFAIDCEAERVQVLTLDGRCCGSFAELSSDRRLG